MCAFVSVTVSVYVHLQCDVLHAVNPNDYEDAGQKQPKELCFDAHFEGIEVHVAHEQVDIAYAQISGQFEVDVGFDSLSVKFFVNVFVERFFGKR